MGDSFCTIVPEEILVTSTEYELVCLFEGNKQLVLVCLWDSHRICKVKLEFQRSTCIVSTPPIYICFWVLGLDLHFQYIFVDEVVKCLIGDFLLKLSLVAFNCCGIVSKLCEVWCLNWKEKENFHLAVSAHTFYLYWKRNFDFRCLVLFWRALCEIETSLRF